MTTSEKVLSLLQDTATEPCWTLDVTMSIFVLLLYLLEYFSYQKKSICLLICKLLNKVYHYCCHDTGHITDKQYIQIKFKFEL